MRPANQFSMLQLPPKWAKRRDARLSNHSVGLRAPSNGHALLSNEQKAKRVEWAVRYHKVNFSNVIFTDECRATMDGPDGWALGWVLDQHQPKLRMRRQQGGGGIMFWADIQGSTIIGPYNMVPEGVKINAKAYCELLDQFLLPWLENQPLLRRRKLIFQHDKQSSPPNGLTTTASGKIR